MRGSHSSLCKKAVCVSAAAIHKMLQVHAVAESGKGGQANTATLVACVVIKSSSNNLQGPFTDEANTHCNHGLASAVVIQSDRFKRA